MKKSLLVVSLLAGSILFISGYVSAQDEVVGPMSLNRMYPKMLEVETCSQAYDDFKKVASPIKSCHDIEEAEFNAKTQQSVIDALKGIKAKEAEIKTAEAKQKLNAANATISDLKDDCPKGKQFVKLIHQLGKKVKDVCERCNKKWPGDIGPIGGNPCN